MTLHRYYKQTAAHLRCGRKRTIRSNLRNIYRVHRSQGYYLHKSFRGVAYRVFFGDRTYGGKAEALAAAETERDWLDAHRAMILQKQALMTFQALMSKRKVSSIKRVVKSVLKDLSAGQK